MHVYTFHLILKTLKCTDLKRLSPEKLHKKLSKGGLFEVSKRKSNIHLLHEYPEHSDSKER
ncbi:hypothetical protein WQ54_05795 [Bacillus sp. SA1-12]|nr:hypothetical protein WQ54_05795 [Bacillus sp. SA1-12]